jgi:hypothetical protein
MCARNGETVGMQYLEVELIDNRTREAELSKVATRSRGRQYPKNGRMRVKWHHWATMKVN